MISKTTSAGSGISTTRPPRDAELRRHISRFLVIGGCSVATDLAAYHWLQTAGFSAHVAKAISYVVGMAVGFVGNKFWTFESPRRSFWEPVLYTTLYAVTLAVNVTVNAAVLRWLGAGGSHVAFLAATGVTTVLNFLGLRTLTFREGIRQRRKAGTRSE